MAKIGSVGKHPQVVSTKAPVAEKAKAPQAAAQKKAPGFTARAASQAASVVEAKQIELPKLSKPMSQMPVVGEYDYVIVGSGAGGAPLAAELAKKGFSVCVLEAGSGAEDPASVVPSFHALASEASTSAKFFVTQDSKLDKKDP